MTNHAPLQAYKELFNSVKTSLEGSTLLSVKRQEALDYFVKQGFPKASDEAWKYTRLPLFLNTPLPLAKRESVTPATLAPFLIDNLPCHRMVFVNGWFDAALSDTDISGLHPMADSPELQVTAKATHVMEALNLAFMSDGLVLTLKKGAALDKPVHVIFVTTSGAGYTRNKIILDEGSKATLIESHVSLGGASAKSFSSAATKITLKPGATLQHYKGQHENNGTDHIASTHVTLGKESSYTRFVFNSGGNLSRDEVHVDMNGNHASTKLYGIYLGQGKQHLDHYTPIYHNAPYCYSKQAYRGILDGNATGIFYGKISVSPGAQKTDAYQSNHSLLLSEHARAYSRPELEIHADDVKCGHGSATGMVDKEALFYLRSRGIGEPEAYALLVEGFVGELLEEVSPQSLKQHWQGVLHLWSGTKR